MPHEGRTSDPSLGADVRDSGEGARKDFPADEGGAGHGTRQQYQSLQAAAPQRGRQSGVQQGPMVDPVDIFGPSMRPNEPATAGIGPGEDQRQFVPKDPDLALKALYAKHPHPDILKLLKRRMR